MHMWAVPTGTLLPHGGLENVKLLCFEYISMLMYKYIFQIIAK